MKAKIEILESGSNIMIPVDLSCYDYEVTVGEVAWRFHSAMQQKSAPTSFFDDMLPCWVFRAAYQPEGYKIMSIEISSDNLSGKIPHDDFANMETPKVTRKPRRVKQEQFKIEGIEE